MVYEQNRNTGRLLVDQVMYFKHWEKLETTTRSLQQVVQDLSKRLSKQKYEWRFIKPNSDRRRQRCRRDEFEWAVLRPLQQAAGPSGPTRTSPKIIRERLVDNNNEYQYFQPIYADKSCLLCHNVIPADRLSGTGMSLGGNVTNGAR